MRVMYVEGVRLEAQLGRKHQRTSLPPRTIVRVFNTGMTMATKGNAYDFGELEASRNPEQLCEFQSPKPDF